MEVCVRSRDVNKGGEVFIEAWFVLILIGLPASLVKFESREAKDVFDVVSLYFAQNWSSLLVMRSIPSLPSFLLCAFFARTMW